jgi:hypothetical protein
MTNNEKNLIWLVYPNAYIICDKTKEENGDFMEVARITFNDGEITTRKGSDIPSETMAKLIAEQKRIKSHEKIEIDACGQYVIGGRDLI